MTALAVAALQTIARPGDVQGSVEDHLRLAIRAAERGARLAVFPELSLTGYDRGLTHADAISPGDARLQSLQRAADDQDVTIVVGAPLISPHGLEIGSICFVPRREPMTYSKRFLHEGEENAFVPGPGGLPLSIRGETVCLAICADTTHPEHARAAALRGAGLYAASSFITPEGYAADAAQLAGYAAEHGMSVLMANYGSRTGGWESAGRSAIWSLAGTLLAQAPPRGEHVLVAEVPLRQTVERAIE
jgi:predicted amidohydrolase